MHKTINLEKLKKDMERWPKSWAGFASDIATGKEIVQVLRRFLMVMVADQLAYTTINRHLGNLWLLGGEIIYRVNMDPELKGLNGKQLILEFINKEGGPLCRHLATEGRAADIRLHLQEAPPVHDSKISSKANRLTRLPYSSNHKAQPSTTKHCALIQPKALQPALPGRLHLGPSCFGRSRKHSSSGSAELPLDLLNRFAGLCFPNLRPPRLPGLSQRL